MAQLAGTLQCTFIAVGLCNLPCMCCLLFLQGIAKARDCGFIDASNGTWRFDLAEYEHYEQVRVLSS
jgi:hypothetical protein